MEVLYLVKIFDGEFSPALCVLRLPESKKVLFENWSVCLYVYKCREYSVLYIYKTIKDRNSKMYTQYQISV